MPELVKEWQMGETKYGDQVKVRLFDDGTLQCTCGGRQRVGIWGGNCGHVALLENLAFTLWETRSGLVEKMPARWKPSPLQTKVTRLYPGIDAQAIERLRDPNSAQAEEPLSDDYRAITFDE